MARKTKAKIVYRPEADQDIAGKAAYTIARWGKKQAQLYLGDIRRTIERLPDTGRRQPHVEELYPGLQRIRSGRHLIYFIIDQDMIAVVRILHERMDMRRHIEG